MSEAKSNTLEGAKHEVEVWVESGNEIEDVIIFTPLYTVKQSGLKLIPYKN